MALILIRVRIMFKQKRNLLQTILDLAFPPACYICNASCSGIYGLCNECLSKVRLNPPPYCSKCGKHLTNRSRDKSNLCIECTQRTVFIEKAWSSCIYEGVIRECIHLFKYKSHIGLKDLFKEIIIEFIKQNEILASIDAIVPVPIYHVKRRERGYNHAEVLAKIIAKNFKRPIITKSLRKIVWTRSQSELDKKGRTENVKDTFIVVDKDIVKGKNILLVDDIYTTGATLNECAKVLKKVGSVYIFSFTLARGE